jgi:hypothetical protein
MAYSVDILIFFHLFGVVGITTKSTIYELGLSVTPLEGIPLLFDYIKEWKLAPWETTFFKKFISKDRVKHTKAFD